jgi:anti-sigma regulatory factor (Ser/Thr protein kinase)
MRTGDLQEQHTMNLDHPGRAPDPVILRWGRHPSSVGRARCALRKTLPEWGLVTLEDTATLVLSELLTNAVRHARVPAGREIETRWATASGGLRIEVHDASPTRPERRPAPPDACDGRGLALVAALADAWGVSGRNGPGKMVWAHLVPPPPTGEARQGPDGN